MNRIIFAIVLSLFAGSAMAEPLVLQVDAKPAHKMAVQAHRNSFHLPPLPPPLVFPGDAPKPAATPVADLATVLSTIAIPDLQAAAANAAAQTPPDVTAETCWNGLIPIAQQIPQQIQSQLPQPNGKFGLAMTIQLARDIINAPTSPVVKQVNLACAALYMDTKVGLVNFAAQLAGMFAAAAVVAPIKPLPIP